MAGEKEISLSPQDNDRLFRLMAEELKHNLQPDDKTKMESQWTRPDHWTPGLIFEAAWHQANLPLPPHPEDPQSGLRYLRPTSLPKSLNMRNFDEEEHLSALHDLLNAANRRTGKTYLPKGGKRTGRRGTRGFSGTDIHKIEVVENLLHCVVNALDEKQLELPEAPKKEMGRRTSEKTYAPYAKELKVAFCAGLGMDPSQDQRPFVTLFRGKYFTVFSRGLNERFDAPELASIIYDKRHPDAPPKERSVGKASLNRIISTVLDNTACSEVPSRPGALPPLMDGELAKECGEVIAEKFRERRTTRPSPPPRQNDPPDGTRGR